jgi:SAM-dependent methyltransferase
MARGSEVGGMWDEIGQLQFDFLLHAGLKPEHYLLDIGCGSLRGGVHFVRYLKPRHYYGLEKEAGLVKAGADLIGAKGLDGKAATLILRGDFDIGFLRRGLRFDYMLAHSVFTHLVPEQVELCLRRVLPRLKHGGSLYATFWRDDVLVISREHPTRKGERQFVRYPIQGMADLVGIAGGVADYLGEWGHPRGQVMMRVTRSRPRQRQPTSAPETRLART